MILGSEIGNTFFTFFEKKRIDMKNVRGQCYDGTPTQFVIRESWCKLCHLDKSPKACVNHCCSHNLNLSIAQCANIQVINNVVEKYKASQNYFQTSQKIKSFLEHIVSLHLHDVCQLKVLREICSTRW